MMQSHTPTRSRWVVPSIPLVVAIITVLALTLTGCTPAAEQEVYTPPPDSTATPPPPLPTQPLAINTAEPPSPPTRAPASPEPLVGPEWQVAFDGDLNRDGQRDVVAYKASSVVPDEAMGSFQQGPFAIVEMVIVQENQAGEPAVQASASPGDGIQAGGTELLPEEQFGEPGPAAFLLGVDTESEAPVSLIPLNAEGKAYAQGVGLYWNEGHQAYRLFVGGQPVPPPDTPDGSTLPRTPPQPSETQSPDETEIVLYWLVGESLQPEYRRIQRTPAIGTATLEALLAGPREPGLSTAIPTPEEVQQYPGREDDWGERVRLLNLTIEDGVATANFSQEMRAYGGGSARVQSIREQINRTLKQFPTVDEVRIAIEGETEGVLQP